MYSNVNQSTASSAEEDEKSRSASLKKKEIAKYINKQFDEIIVVEEGAVIYDNRNSTAEG